VVKEVDVALKAHELIKVRAPGIERDEREATLRTLCERTQAEAVQTIGKVFVIYRKRDE
jgi:RNA-binding protein